MASRQRLRFNELAKPLRARGPVMQEGRATLTHDLSSRRHKANAMTSSARPPQLWLPPKQPLAIGHDRNIYSLSE